MSKFCTAVNTSYMVWKLLLYRTQQEQLAGVSYDRRNDGWLRLHCCLLLLSIVTPRPKLLRLLYDYCCTLIAPNYYARALNEMLPTCHTERERGREGEKGAVFSSPKIQYKDMSTYLSYPTLPHETSTVRPS